MYMNYKVSFNMAHSLKLVSCKRNMWGFTNMLLVQGYKIYIFRVVIYISF
jgi:hypothetical protein